MVLKKYANRRLYDTGHSRYVTLDEVTERIRAGEDVMVLDAATGADLTQATLTQLILENRGAAKLLPVPLLTQLVRLGDDGLAEFFSRWVQWALESYVHGRQGMQWLQQLAPMITAGHSSPPPVGAPTASQPSQTPPAPAPFSPAQFLANQFGGGGFSPSQFSPGQFSPSQWVPQWPMNSPLGALASFFEQHRGQQPQQPQYQAQRQPQAQAQSPQHQQHQQQQPQRQPPIDGGQHDEVERLRKQLDELRAGLIGRKRGPKKKPATGGASD